MKALDLAVEICELVSAKVEDTSSLVVSDALLLAMQIMLGVDAAARVISDCAPKRSPGLHALKKSARLSLDLQQKLYDGILLDRQGR